MYQLAITLSDIDYKEDVFLALQSIGVTAASIVESKNMSRSLESEFSLFTGFLNSKTAREGEQLFILCTIESPDLAREFVGNLEASGINFKKKSNILSFTLTPLTLGFQAGEYY